VRASLIKNDVLVIPAWR